MELFPTEFDDALHLEVLNANFMIDDTIGVAQMPLSDCPTQKARLGLQLNAGGVIECTVSLQKRKKIDKKNLKKTVTPKLSSKEVKEKGSQLGQRPCSNKVL
jgi:hypothetical protein